MNLEFDNFSDQDKKDVACVELEVESMLYDVVVENQYCFRSLDCRLM